MTPKDKDLAGSLRRLKATVSTIDSVLACRTRDRVGLGTGSAAGRRAARAAAHDTSWSMAIFGLQQNRFGNAVFVYSHIIPAFIHSFYSSLVSRLFFTPLTHPAHVFPYRLRWSAGPVPVSAKPSQSLR